MSQQEQAAGQARQPLRAVITGNRLVNEHTEYRVELCAGSATLSSVSRRFRMFTELHAQLSKFPHAFPIPEIPPKKFFGRTNPGFVAKRQRELQAFLDQLVDGIIANPPSESAWRLLCLFLALDPKQDVPDVILNLADGRGAARPAAGGQAALGPTGLDMHVGFDTTGSNAMLAMPDAENDLQQDQQNLEAEEVRRMDKIVDEFAQQTINVSRRAEERLQVPPPSFLTAALLESLATELDTHIVSRPFERPEAVQDEVDAAADADGAAMGAGSGKVTGSPQQEPQLLSGAADLVVSLDELSVEAASAIK